jgi:hypothetical protein
MKTRNTLIALGIAAALAAGAGVYSFTASAQDGPGYGPGMMDGYGPGYGPMHGYGPGYGHMRGWGGRPAAGSWNCPGFGSDDARGQGYGPRNQMRGWGGGYGPGMMQGYGYGRGGYQGNLNLTTDDVKSRMERWLAWRGNPRLKLGEVKEKDADLITADIVTKDNALVDRFVVDRHTGFTRRDNG